MCGQKSPTTKTKIEAAFVRLDKLGLGEESDDVADAQESMRRADLLMSVATPCSNQPCADPFLEPSILSSTSFKSYWVASRPWVTKKRKRMFRLYLNSWTTFETLSLIIRSVVISNSFYNLLIQAPGPDGTTTGHIRSESKTHCESPKQIRVNVSNSSTGSRSDSPRTKIETS